MDTLIGTVPDHWRQEALSDFCEILAGPSNARPTSDPDNIPKTPIVTPKDIIDGRISDKPSTWIDQGAAPTLTRYTLELGDIVCVRTGEVGRHALVGAATPAMSSATAYSGFAPIGQ